MLCVTRRNVVPCDIYPALPLDENPVGGLYMKIAFDASPRPAAQRALEKLVGRYGQCTVAEADCVISLGGDGTVLRVLH